MTVIDRAEPAILAVLIATAGVFVAVGVAVEQAGRAWQWLGREIDRAFIGSRL